MILKEISNAECLGFEDSINKKMGIKQEDYKKLRAILSTNLYSDPIGSTIREVCSNALDGCKEAKIDALIQVNLQRKNGVFVFSVQDEGFGMSPERVDEVFSNFLSSTKENSEEELGYFGLGAKAPLSYTDSFTIISIFDNVKSTYIMHKDIDEDVISLVDQEECFNHNGVTIEIILKSDEDYDTFINKIKAQLCYFEGVIIKDYYNEVPNDYKIIKTDEWKYSELNQDSCLHLCLQDVYYPIDFKALGIESIKLPVGLNFSLKDGLQPIPSRESIKMTPATKQLILNRIRSVGNYFCDKWNLLVPSAETYEEAKQMNKNLFEIPIYSETTLTGGKKITVKIPKNIVKYCDRQLKSVSLSLFPNLDLENIEKNNSFLYQEYKIVNRFNDGKFTSNVQGCIINQYNNTMIYLKVGETLSKSQIDYLRWTENKSLVIRKHKPLRLGKVSKYTGSLDCYIGLLNLNKYPKNKWRKIIDEYQKLQDSYVNKWTTIDTIIPSQAYLDWKKEHKEKTKRIKLGVEEIKVFIGREPLNRRARKDIIYESDTYKITKLEEINLSRDTETKKIKSRPFKFIYADESREDELNKFINFLDYKIALVNKKTYNILKKLNLHNWTTIDDILTKKNRNLTENVTDTIKNKVLELRKGNLYDTTIDSIITVNSKLGNKFKKVIKYSKKSIPPIFYIRILKLYIENRWFDYTIWDDIKIVYENLPSLQFTQDIEGLYNRNPYYNKFIKIVWNDYKDKKQVIPFNDFLKNIVNNLK